MANEGGYSAGSIFLQVVPSFSGFEREARRVAKGMEGIFEDSLDRAGERGANKARQHMDEALAGQGARNAGRKGGQATGEEFSTAFEKIMQKRLGNAIAAIGKSGGDQLNHIERRLQSLKGAKVGVDLDAGTLLAEVKAIDAEVDKLTRDRKMTIDGRINAKIMLGELREINREIKGVDGKKINVRVDYNDHGAAGKLAAFNKIIGRSGNQAEDTANSFRTFNGVLLTSVTLGPALIPILTAIAGGLLALGPAAVAAGAGLGVLAIGFSGLGDAIGALNDAQKNSAKETQASAKKIRGAAEGVADAEKRLTRAVRDAKQSRSDAARRVADAEQSSARSIESALGRQEDAEKSLRDAQKDSLKAQTDLIEARREAQRDLDDIADRQKRNSLDERQAVIDLFNATVAYNAVREDAGSTNLEREQADINLENARLRLKDIRDEEKDLNGERQKGVAGSDKVRTAEERVADTLDRQKDAQKNLIDAQKEVMRARVDGARDISDAVEAQKRTEVDAAEQVADSQRALTRAQQDYRDALYETGEIGSASAQKLADAMALLGPAGQEFARFIFGLKDEFLAVRNAVQAGLFPGLTEAISTLVKTYLPDFTAFMGEIGTIFGDIAKLTAQTLTNDTWKQFFSVFREISPDLIKNYADVFLNLATVVAQVMTITGPFAVEFSKALADITGQMVKFMSSKEGQELWLRFLDNVKRVGPSVMKFFEALVPAFLALLEALEPLGELILAGLTAFLEWIAAMDPKTLQGIVYTILTLIAAFQIAAGIIAGVAAIFTPFGAILGGVVVAIVILIGALVYLYTTSETARKIIDSVFSAIATGVMWYINEIMIPTLKLLWTVVGEVFNGIKWFWENVLSPVFTAIGAGLSWLWENILKPVFETLGPLVARIFRDIKWAWENVLWPVLKVIGKIIWELWEFSFKVAFNFIKGGFEGLAKGIKFVWDKILFPIINGIATALGIDLNGKSLQHGLVAAFRAAFKIIGTIWDGLKTMAKGPVDFVISTVLNGGLIDGFNFLASKLGMDPVAHIPWPPKNFADGGVESSYGVRPGYTPGRDTHLIHVGGGEAILRPELTRALGSDWVYAANARAKRGGVNGARRFLGGFKNGGIAGGDFERTSWRGHAFNNRTVRMLQSAERLAGQVIRITQGSYSNSVAASGSTHSGGGAFDAGWPGAALGRTLVSALRLVGFAAWHRDPSQGPWPAHIHGIAAGDPTASPAAQRQVADYYRGGDGLGGRDDGPQVQKDPSLLDRIGGGISGIADWVVDAISKPLDYLKGKIEGPIKQLTEKFGDNWMTQTLGKIPERLMDSMVNKLKGFFGGGDEGGDGSLKSMVQQMAMTKFGWSGNQWDAIDWIVGKESSWNPKADNPSSSAYGLFQLIAANGGQTDDPSEQARRGLQYIQDRYGDPVKAKKFWEGHGWYADGGIVPNAAGVDAQLGGLPDNGTMMYDNGGYLPPGLTTVVNLTGKPEPVFTAQQFEGMSGGGSGIHYEPHFNASDLTADDVMDDFKFEVRRLGRGSN